MIRSILTYGLLLATLAGAWAQEAFVEPPLPGPTPAVHPLPLPPTRPPAARPGARPTPIAKPMPPLHGAPPPKEPKARAEKLQPQRPAPLPPKPEPAPAPPPPPPGPSAAESFESELPANPLAGLALSSSGAIPQHQYDVGIRGNTHFSDSELRDAIADQLTAIRENGLTPASADDTAFFLSAFYRKHGYSQATVQWKIAGRLLLLDISEGPLAHIARIRFAGNHTIPSSKLEEILTGFAAGKKKVAIPFSEAEVSSGVARVRGYYLSQGYLDSKVKDAIISLSRDKTKASIAVAIEEGIQYRFGKLTLEGEVLFFPQDELLKELEVFSSRPYTPATLTNLQRKVGDFYRSRGYFRAKVEAEADPASAVSGIVPVVFHIDSGEPYIFGAITQKGIARLRPSFLYNRFKSLIGQPYNPRELDERYRHIMTTGLFSTMKINQKAQPNNQVELEFEVEEAKSREVGFSIGYGSLEGAILGARFLDRNVFGFGRPLSLNAEIAQRLLRGELLFVDPWLFDSNYTMRLRLYALTQDLFDYSKVESGFRGELSRRFGEHFEVTGFLLTRVVNISSGKIDPVDLGPTNYIANSVGASLTLDYRDSVLNPSKGFVATTSADVALDALGSSLNFFRSTGRVSYYHPIGNTLLAVGVRGGFILPLRGDLPIDERFFLGGSRTVRSYVERSLGPKDRYGNSIGGETFGVLNIENTFPIAGNLKGAVFFDAGTVGRTVSGGNFKTGLAVGAGLRYDLPVGPLRIDYGFNPLRRKDDPTGAWHFSFGFAF